MKPLVNKWQEVSEAEAKLDGGTPRNVLGLLRTRCKTVLFSPAVDLDIMNLA
jgi:hypothetical protein